MRNTKTGRALRRLTAAILLLLCASGAVAEGAPTLTNLVWQKSLKLEYAQCFTVDYYEGGYALIAVDDGRNYLLVPEEMPVPEGLPDSVIVLRQPIKRIYLAATSAMALFDSLDALGQIRLAGTQASGWAIQDAAAAMNAGDILFAGKYSEPDYELLLQENCDLAVESTMILHSPEVQEMLELLGIPVLIDRSSYESHPLGRTEWIKLYGVLTGTKARAEEFFRTQSAAVDALKDFENTEKTVAFFYLSTDGTVVVRASSDYVARMIEIAGGRYAFRDLPESGSSRSSVSMTMEEFYATAVDADYLIYNGTIDNPIASVDELIGKSGLFADFKAVQAGNVWTTDKYLYQATDVIGEMITDIHGMLTGQGSEGRFIHHLQ